MHLVGQADDEELTIVSRRLLRVGRADWGSPEDHFQRLQGSALDVLLTAVKATGNLGDRERCLRVLLLLDCMMRVIGEPAMASSLAFATPRFKTLQHWFFGALGSAKFINVAAATRRDWAETFYRLLERLSVLTQVCLPDHRATYNADIPAELIQGFEELQLDTAEVQLLRPFLLKDKCGAEYNVLLSPMLPALGRRFTEVFHAGLRVIARPKAKDAALRDFGTTFARFIAHQHSLGRPVSPELLQTPGHVQTLVVDFMEYHFMKMTRRRGPVQEGTLPSLQKLWSRYRGYWDALVRQQILAAPSTSFPAGNPRLLTHDAVAHRRVEAADDGSTMTVTQKLLAPIPLHVTDEEATQLLFRRLRADFHTVQGWLRSHLDSLIGDYERGCALAASVDILPSVESMKTLTKQQWKSTSGIALALKYFKSAHGGYVDTSRTRTPVYPNLAARDGPPKQEVSRLLGLPSRRDAMALMAFLASSDGRFSEAATSALVLLDANGRRVNAVETDGGLALTVLKEREAGDGWHEVLLNGEAATYVRRWIQLTEPLRAYMRAKGLKGWRNLFIYVGNPLGAPGCFSRSTNIHSAFRCFALSNESALADLAGRVTIPRIRSTRGVLVFLESMDLTAMARELGNNNETSLRHYLPDSLWDYFTTRWLRVFQNLLIIAATKDTPYMQRALRFATVAEMDEFLRNHAITPLIPVDDVPPAPARSAGELSEVMVPASVGLFAMLQSISAAADKAESEGRSVAPKALYWAEFSRRLKGFIESDAFHDRGVKRMMVAARADVDPALYEGVVSA